LKSLFNIQRKKFRIFASKNSKNKIFIISKLIIFLKKNQMIYETSKIAE